MRESTRVAKEFSAAFGVAVLRHKHPYRDSSTVQLTIRTVDAESHPSFPCELERRIAFGFTGSIPEKTWIRLPAGWRNPTRILDNEKQN